MQIFSPPLFYNVPRLFNEEGELLFYKRIDSVLKPLVTCSEQVYEANRAKVVDCAKEVGRIHLSRGPLSRADWTMKDPPKNAVMVSPNVLIVKDEHGHPFDVPAGNVVLIGTAQTPSKDRISAYPDGTKVIQAADYYFMSRRPPNPPEPTVQK